MIEVTIFHLAKGEKLTRSVVIGSVLSEVLNREGFVVDFSKEVLNVNQQKIEEGEVDLELYEDSIISITFPVKASAPTPKLKKVRRYLKQRGYTETPGRGDHIKFTSSTGAAVTINPDNSDRKHICLGSAKQLALHLHKNLNQLNEMLS